MGGARPKKHDAQHPVISGRLLCKDKAEETETF